MKRLAECLKTSVCPRWGICETATPRTISRQVTVTVPLRAVLRSLASTRMASVVVPFLPEVGDTWIQGSEAVAVQL